MRLRLDDQAISSPSNSSNNPSIPPARRLEVSELD
jgi:hypothetical protein